MSVPVKSGTRLGRLLERRDFLRVAGQRRKWVATGFILQVAPSDAPEKAGFGAEGRRIGFTASKKVGNSVCRSRTKRRLRHAAQQILAPHASAGYDFVLIGRQETADYPFDRLLADLETALRRLKLWREDSLPQDAG